jgi:hypothetical protein
LLPRGGEKYGRDATLTIFQTVSEGFFPETGLLRYLELLHTAIISGAYALKEFNLLGERRSKGKG